LELHRVEFFEQWKKVVLRLREHNSYEVRIL
jgi:hypothetical protein